MAKCGGIFLLALIVLIGCVYEGHAIRCFQCNSVFSKNCGETIRLNEPAVSPVVECANIANPFVTRQTECRKIKYKSVSGQWEFIRGCSENDHPEIGLQDATVHMCSTDACNSAGIAAPAVVIAMATPLIVLATRFI